MKQSLLACLALSLTITASAQRDPAETTEVTDPQSAAGVPAVPAAPPATAEEGEDETEGSEPDEDVLESPANEGGDETNAEADPDGGAASSDSESLAEDDRLQLIVIDAAAFQVDPVVGEHVSRELRVTAEAMGYNVLSPEASVSAAQRMTMPYPPSPADLWQVTVVGGAQRGVFARVWADQGLYVVELSVASVDGAGPFFARGQTDAEHLHEEVGRLLRSALPGPEHYDQQAAARLLNPARADEQEVAPDRDGPRSSTLPQVEVRARRDLRPSRRWDLAFQTEAVIGLTSDGFYSHLFGVRLGFRITNTLILGLYGGYINLPTREGRGGNFLPMLQLENRFRISSRSGITIPVRASVGFLPFNGAVLRLAAGLNIPVSQRIELHVDVLTPTFWFLPEQTLVSLNIGLELIYRL